MDPIRKHQRLQDFHREGNDEDVENSGVFVLAANPRPVGLDLLVVNQMVHVLACQVLDFVDVFSG